MHSEEIQSQKIKKSSLGSSPNWKEWKKEKKKLQKEWMEKKMLKKLKKKDKEAVKETTLKQTSIEEDKKENNSKGRHYTVSIALPGSILDNAQSIHLRTYLAGQIARAAAVFCIDEVVIFDETGTTTLTEQTVEGKFEGIGKKGLGNVQLARILQYLECPQYLRKYLFPIHKDLSHAGLLNPLDTPHHLRTDDKCNYREGVVLNKPVKDGKGSFVYVGVQKTLQIDRHLQPGVRVTVKLDENTIDRKKMHGKAVAPSIPRLESGLYWGYSVRLAKSLGDVFTECSFKDGYDLTIGTSERGDSIDTINLPSFKHLLIVFGGLGGLEASLEADEALTVDDPKFLFHYYLNTCPDQGSRVIRTEEAILISLSSLRPKILQAQLNIL